METTEITIKPEFAIGTEIWIMVNNKPKLCLIAEINITVTSYTDTKLGWYDQLWSRWHCGKAKQTYRHYFTYGVKMENDISLYKMYKVREIWEILGRKVYTSIDQLKNDL